MTGFVVECSAGQPCFGTVKEGEITGHHVAGKYQGFACVHNLQPFTIMERSDRAIVYEGHK